MADPKPPPSIKVPPPRPKKKAKGSAFEEYIKAHPALKPWAAGIQKWADVYGIDPLYYAALIWFESKGDPNAKSNKNAVGLVQIHLPSHPGVTEAQARNPAFALKWGARFFAEKLAAAGGNYDKAYRGKGGYNPGYTGTGPFAGLPVPGRAGLTPTEKARVGEEELAAARRVQAPRIAREEFKRYWNQLNDIYQSYAGRNATHKEALAIYKNGLSSYAIIKGLTKRKSFFGSPVWEAKSRDYYGIARDLGMKVDRKLVAQAIANNWDGSAFAEKLRELPGYLGSSEFKNQTASFGNIYRSIYGEPDAQAQLFLKEAALGRWKPDQVAAYLRDLPEYRQSAEYQTKIYGLQAALGFLPTQQAAPPPVPGPRPVAPDSPRIKGSPNY